VTNMSIGLLLIDRTTFHGVVRMKTTYSVAVALVAASRSDHWHTSSHGQPSPRLLRRGRRRHQSMSSTSMRRGSGHHREAAATRRRGGKVESLRGRRQPASS
jgi:hypothetical protein